MSLKNRTIALAEGRQLEELAAMLEKEGATILRCPLLSILDATDSAPIIAWLHELIADRFDYVILLTGEGFRRLHGFAQREGISEAFLAAMAKTRLITRGPKPGQALKQVGLAPTKVAAAPTTEGVIQTLRNEPLTGKTIGIQLYSEQNPPLIDFVASVGAVARPIQPYYYAPAADAERVGQMIRTMKTGEISAVVFTSSPQIDRVFEVAAELKLETDLKEGLERTQIAAVGPIVAETLRARGCRVDITPDQGFVMKNLVQYIKRAFQ